ncbi:hypothetical protein TRIUR3_25337 [Triticum urartu]|uniref:Uncharacterized protein n=2 Tax=Triticinae TaxID=1648030 RepID=M7ZNH6_TRIUA|nr:hypothetical protein TRIUR3_25337 [Triticum urartu]
MEKHNFHVIPLPISVEALVPSKVASADSKNQEQWAPELGIGRENKSDKTVMDKKFLEKVEAVRSSQEWVKHRGLRVRGQSVGDLKRLGRAGDLKRSALDKKKVEENKNYQAIDYDAPIESDKSTLGFGTRVGIGIAVVVFGLVFTFGDFLPSGSVSPSNESTVVNKQLSEEERTNYKRALEGYEETLTKSPNDPTALEAILWIMMSVKYGEQQKHRNAVFDNAQPSIFSLLDTIKVEARSWAKAGEGAAVSLVELGEYQKASDLLEKLVKVIPDKAEAYRLLGEVKFELKDYDGSSSSYRNSLSSSDSIDFDVLRGLTNSLVAAKKPDQAVEVILSCRRKLSEKRQTRQPDLEAANENGAQESRDIDPIQVESNKTSLDVKGLFLGVRFVLRRVNGYKLVRLQLEDKLHVQVGCSVRVRNGPNGLGWRYSPLVLGLIRDKGRLLRGQVDLLLGKAYSDWGHISDAVTVYDNLITEHPEDFRGYLAKGAILKQNGKAGDAERMFIQAKFFAPEAAKALVDIYAQR